MLKASISVGMILAVYCLVACEAEPGSVEETLRHSQWVSSVLYEAPDYRDAIVFHPDRSLTYFDAASVQELKGSYSIASDTIALTVFDSLLGDTLRYRLVLSDDTLRTVDDRGEPGKWHFYPAPKDRELL